MTEVDTSSTSWIPFPSYSNLPQLETEAKPTKNPRGRPRKRSQEEISSTNVFKIEERPCSNKVISPEAKKNLLKDYEYYKDFFSLTMTKKVELLAKKYDLTYSQVYSILNP
jgi:hypothetical protein